MYDSSMLVTISLNEAACRQALRDRRPRALGPAARAAIRNARRSGPGMAVREVSCSIKHAREMLEYFHRVADALSVEGDVQATHCADAYNNVQRELKVVGAIS